MRSAFAFLPSRVGAALFGSMGLLGLALASIGLYGVLVYAVSRRIREIGLRIALGADRRAIVGMVLRQSLSLVIVGVAIGLGIAAIRHAATGHVPGAGTEPDRPGDVRRSGRGLAGGGARCDARARAYAPCAWIR